VRDQRAVHLARLPATRKLPDGVLHGYVLERAAAWASQHRSSVFQRLLHRQLLRPDRTVRRVQGARHHVHRGLRVRRRSELPGQSNEPEHARVPADDGYEWSVWLVQRLPQVVGSLHQRRMPPCWAHRRSLPATGRSVSTNAPMRRRHVCVAAGVRPVVQQLPELYGLVLRSNNLGLPPEARRRADVQPSVRRHGLHERSLRLGESLRDTKLLLVPQLPRVRCGELATGSGEVARAMP
jgi:hypothetical protein